MKAYFKALGRGLYFAFAIALGGWLCTVGPFTMMWGWPWVVALIVCAWLFFTIVYLDANGILHVVPVD